MVEAKRNKALIPATTILCPQGKEDAVLTDPRAQPCDVEIHQREQSVRSRNRRCGFRSEQLGEMDRLAESTAQLLLERDAFRFVHMSGDKIVLIKQLSPS